MRRRLLIHRELGGNRVAAQLYWQGEVIQEKSPSARCNPPDVFKENMTFTALIYIDASE